LVQSQPPQRQLGNVAMALMRRIERAAEQTDARPPPVAACRQADTARRLGQGRTWPLPVTM
jgi:hypothetical protein